MQETQNVSSIQSVTQRRTQEDREVLPASPRRTQEDREVLPIAAKVASSQLKALELLARKPPHDQSILAIVKTIVENGTRLLSILTAQAKEHEPVPEQ
ncbi:MAG: hypothetical protein GY722_26555 [bacterium]|nr:hypothetical protein [bacterium]